MPNRIEFERDEWFPVQTFFNAIPDDLFWRVVRSLLAGIGYSINDCHCEFPSDLDDDDEPFHGVRFSFYEDEIILQKQELKNALRQVCHEQVRRKPDERNIMDQLFDE